MNVWTVTSAAEHLISIRSDLDLAAGTALQYVATLDGAYTTTMAVLASEVSQGVGLAISSVLTASAPGPGIVARMLDAGLTPRPGTKSRYIVRVQGAGEIPLGTGLQGGGPLGRSRWAVVDPTAIYDDDDPITIEAVDNGPISIPSPTTLTLTAPITGVTGFGYLVGDGDAFSLGTLPESLPAMRVRLQERRAAPGSGPGIRDALQDLAWVEAVDVRPSAPGVLAITIAPAPVGADREAELAAAMLAGLPGTAETVGASSVLGVDANGSPRTYRYTAGTAVAVAVVIVLELDGTVPAADAEAGAIAAVQQAFARLGNGDPIYHLRAEAAISIAGVTGGSVTLDGSDADVSPPTVADVLIAAPITVSSS